MLHFSLTQHYDLSKLSPIPESYTSRRRRVFLGILKAVAHIYMHDGG